jgi:hypothetical protein
VINGETPKAKIEKFCKVPQPIIFKRENDDVVSDQISSLILTPGTVIAEPTLKTKNIAKVNNNRFKRS